MAARKTPRVVIEKRNGRAVARRIRAGLIAYNAQKVGAPDYRPLLLSARDAKGRIVGGLTGQLYWNALYVELLWLETGRARKSLIYLSTYSFQAPGFYRKLGFRSVGHIRGYPRGATRYFLVKRI